MKNRANNLHNSLFAQLERLSDLDEGEMKSELLVNEIKRAEAIVKVSAQIINNGQMVLDAMKFAASASIEVDLPEMFVIKEPTAPPKQISYKR